MVTKKISEKTSGISLAGFQPRSNSTSAQQPTNAQEVQPTKAVTGVGMVFNALTGKDNVSRQLEETKAKLDAVQKEVDSLKEAELVRSLDPTSIKRSRWANRDEASLTSEDFQQLKLEIQSSGGNLQPIKVRPISHTEPQLYEVVFGHRRHRACLELGIPVLAIVEDMGDQELFAQMDRENRQRADLRPYEQGMMYVRALDAGLFSSLRKLADMIGVDNSNVSRAVTLARLPADILDSFDSRLDIQYRWVSELKKAWEKDPEIVTSRAGYIATQKSKLGEKFAPQQIFDLLVGRVSPSKPESRRRLVGSHVLIVTQRKNKVAFEVDALSTDKISKIEDFIAKVIADI